MLHLFQHFVIISSLKESAIGITNAYKDLDEFQFVEQLKSSRLHLGGGCSVSCTGYSPVMRSAKSTMPRMKKSKDVNVVYEGSPSRMRSVLLNSLGMTILPGSSILRTIPVGFIFFSPYSYILPNNANAVCKGLPLMDAEGATDKSFRFRG